jgi:hypothetical protein
MKASENITSTPANTERHDERHRQHRHSRNLGPEGDALMQEWGGHTSHDFQTNLTYARDEHATLAVKKITNASTVKHVEVSLPFCNK